MIEEADISTIVDSKQSKNEDAEEIRYNLSLLALKQTKGFQHPVYSSNLHQIDNLVSRTKEFVAPTIKCRDCLDCFSCDASGLISLNDNVEAPQSEGDSIFFNVVNLVESKVMPINYFHLHLLDSILPNFKSKKFSEEQLKKINSMLFNCVVPIDYDLNSLYIDPSKVSVKCPLCNGNGWKHDIACKQISKKSDVNTRCKNCKNCKACNSTGYVIGKIICKLCSMKGFIHRESNPHDVSPNVRCMYCYECPGCKGDGIVNYGQKSAEIDEYIFKMKCKLYLFQDGNWVERGSGEIQILKHDKAKILEFKSEKNELWVKHTITNQVELKKSGNDKTLCLISLEEENYVVEPKNFSVKFNNITDAEKFRSFFENLQLQFYEQHIRKRQYEKNFEKSIYKEVCKVYYFENAAWIDKGWGDLEIFKNLTGKLSRITMKNHEFNEKIVDHFITNKIELKKVIGNDKSFNWTADNDISKGNPRNFAVKFKSVEGK
ncbi:hypothetical protein HK099_004732 [Clydaea vesicula]|uniref:RanBD1 domain-containing protein n=1 Tax=Clydaea vesicula TaxID=447962 RepID=A0AAD5XVF2_9FUNG|nr:hypothetical protein HK099_004732 [Clydaea vesicula]